MNELDAVHHLQKQCPIDVISQLVTWHIDKVEQLAIGGKFRYEIRHRLGLILVSFEACSSDN